MATRLIGALLATILASCGGTIASPASAGATTVAPTPTSGTVRVHGTYFDTKWDADLAYPTTDEYTVLVYNGTEPSCSQKRPSLPGLRQLLNQKMPCTGNPSNSMQQPQFPIHIVVLINGKIAADTVVTGLSGLN